MIHEASDISKPEQFCDEVQFLIRDIVGSDQSDSLHVYMSNNIGVYEGIDLSDEEIDWTHWLIKHRQDQKIY